VRHRRGTLLALRKGFFDLANLGFLQATNLERAFFERGTGNRQRRQQLGMPITLNDLRCHQCRLETQRSTNVPFN